MPEEPAVELAPKFQVGQTVEHIGEKTDHKILKIVGKNKDLLIVEGLAGTLPSAAFRSKK